MSELDKFKAKSLPPASGGKSLPAVSEGTQLPWEGKPLKPSATAESILAVKQGHFAIALDATGSMSNLIGMAKATISKIVTRVFEEARVQVKIQLFAYRDYDVPQIVVEQSHLSAVPEELTKWLDKIEAIGGGANDAEAIEQALLAAERAGPFDAMLLAGDEPYNSRRNLDQLGKSSVPTAADLARRSRCRIHTFLVGSRSDTEQALQEIATCSGGCFGRLDGSQAMIDMAVLAMLRELGGKRSVQAYMDKNLLGQSSKQFGLLLLKGPDK